MNCAPTWPDGCRIHDACLIIGPNTAGTANTGHGAPRTTRSVTLPRIPSINPRRPAVAMITIRALSNVEDDGA
jgi:hypothetical protein